ncbi:MAG: TetR/AcrR family transcriptional regulator [Candidatus Cloacimonadota bacterium]|nr:TetR/AcrR family transcriptional regulator [Candidatus Cloacimonadota bacterium]
MSVKEKIMQVALQEFMKKGFEKPSMKSIAEKSNVSKGAIYHHFDSKDDLFFHCMKNFRNEIGTWLAEIMKNTTNFKEFIFNYFSLLSEVEKKMKELAQNDKVDPKGYFILMMNAIIKFPQLKDQMSEMYSQLKDTIIHYMTKAQKENIIKQDLDKNITASELTAIFEGTLILNIFTEEGDLEEKSKDLAVNYWNKIIRET